MTSAYLEELNPAQRQAVTHGDGPLLIVAGAGTGKTKTLACRVAYLIEQGVDPQRILLLTFTRRAAAEMLKRASQLTETNMTSKVWGGTFHAVANRLLRIYGQAVQLPTDFTIMDTDDASDMMNLIRTEMGFGKADRRFVRKATLVKIYSHTVNAQEKLKTIVERHFPWCAEDVEAMASIFKEYTERKTASHTLDYDDLLLYWQLLCDSPSVADRFEHILVDEYQDTNLVQADILQGMRKKYNNISVVGDDAQSIYSFRGATVRNILDFPSAYPGTSVITLEQNYRSTTPILHAANAVMRQAKERYTKDLRSDRQSGQKPSLFYCDDEASQTDLVCQSIVSNLEEGIPLMQQAVLFRTGHHSADLEIELARRNIPFHKFGGLKFIEAAHIKDMLALLRILENPNDEISWFRVLNLLDGIGPGWARRIMNNLGVRASEKKNSDEGGNSPLVRLIHSCPNVPARAQEEVESLRTVLTNCYRMTRSSAEKSTATKDLNVASQLEQLGVFYQPIIKRIYDNSPARVRDLEQLEQIAKRYRSRGRFITDLTLDPPTSTADLAQAPYLEEDWVTLSTIHSAKGCEWTSVQILHAADGMIPSDMAVGDEAGIDEERRLLYVAMTRAKDELNIYFPLRYYHRRHRMGDAHTFVQPSRYLTAEVRALLDEKVPGNARGNESKEALDDVLPSQSIGERLNRLWSD